MTKYKASTGVFTAVRFGGWLLCNKHGRKENTNMFTITDYYNLLDFEGYTLDAIQDYGMPFSELINGLYNNFIDNTTKADQQTAHNIIKDMYHASESSKQHILELVDMWAYDSISHGM